MNVSDSELVETLLDRAGYSVAPTVEDADVVLLNTCAIRENAEAKIWQRLGYFKNLKLERRKGRSSEAKTGPIVGVLGCMAERLKQRLLETDKLVDVVVGPDAYRDLPKLIDIVSPGGSKECSTAMNVQLSAEETYADIVPIRKQGAHSVYLSIMRGCNNMCSFCIVPFTRGRERSRPMSSIVDEVRLLSEAGVKEITLLGQNVNSYSDFSQSTGKRETSSMARDNKNQRDFFEEHYAKGFRSVYKPIRDGAYSFAELLHHVASVDPEIRIRFTSPHPKDFSDDVIDVVNSHSNICNQLHMPAQSGSSRMLERMHRGYTREAYDQLVDHIRNKTPGVALSTDMIAGFCGETEEDHQLSLDLMNSVQYELAFLFAYSKRDKTHASRNYEDNVSEATKNRRLQELIAAYRSGLASQAGKEVGRRHLVLVEGKSRRSDKQMTGRTDTFKRAVFDDIQVPSKYKIDIQGKVQNAPLVQLMPGDYVAVQVVDGGRGSTLHCVPLARTTLKEFAGQHGSALPLNSFTL